MFTRGPVENHVPRRTAESARILNLAKTGKPLFCRDVAEGLNIPVRIVRNTIRMMLCVGLLRKVITESSVSHGHSIKYEYTATYQLHYPDSRAHLMLWTTVHVIESLAGRCKFQLCNQLVRFVVGTLLGLGLLQRRLPDPESLEVKLTEHGWTALTTAAGMPRTIRWDETSSSSTAEHKPHTMAVLSYVRQSTPCRWEEIAACLRLSRPVVCGALAVLQGFGLVFRKAERNKDAWYYRYKYAGAYRCVHGLPAGPTLAVQALVCVAATGAAPSCQFPYTLISSIVDIGIFAWTRNRPSMTETGWTVLHNSRGELSKITGDIRKRVCECTNLFGLRPPDLPRISEEWLSRGFGEQPPTSTGETPGEPPQLSDEHWPFGGLGYQRPLPDSSGGSGGSQALCTKETTREAYKPPVSDNSQVSCSDDPKGSDTAGPRPGPGHLYQAQCPGDRAEPDPIDNSQVSCSDYPEGSDAAGPCTGPGYLYQAQCSGGGAEPDYYKDSDTVGPCPGSSYRVQCVGPAPGAWGAATPVETPFDELGWCIDILATLEPSNPNESSTVDATPESGSEGRDYISL